jgi:hypothetical protein
MFSIPPSEEILALVTELCVNLLNVIAPTLCNSVRYRWLWEATTQRHITHRHITHQAFMPHLRFWSWDFRVVSLQRSRRTVELSEKKTILGLTVFRIAEYL